MAIEVYDLLSMEMPALSGYAVKPNGALTDFSMSKIELRDKAGDKQGLNITLEATASGTVINDRVYTGKSVKARANTFKDKPILKHHDSYSDPIGRIRDARFIQLADDLDQADMNPAIQIGGKIKGSPSGIVEVDAFIPELDAMQKIADERFKYASMGGTTNSARCSVCGSNWAEGDFCEHNMGEEYKVEVNGKKQKVTARLLIDIDSYLELSFVNKPAWQNAKVINIENQDLSDEMRERYANIDSALVDMRADIIPSKIKRLSLCDSFGNEFALINDGKAPEPHNIVDNPTEKSEMTEEKQNTKEFTDLQNEVSKLSDQRETLITQLDSKDKAIKDLENSNTKLTTELADANEQIVKLSKDKQVSDAKKLLQMRKVLGKIKDAENEELLDALVGEEPAYIRGCIDSLTDEYEAAVEQATKNDEPVEDEKPNVDAGDIGSGKPDENASEKAQHKTFSQPTELE